MNLILGCSFYSSLQQENRPRRWESRVPYKVYSVRHKPLQTYVHLLQHAWLEISFAIALAGDFLQCLKECKRPILTINCKEKKTNICIIVTTIDLCRIWMKMRTFYTVSFIYFCLLLCTVLQPILIMIKHLVVCLNLGLPCRIERIANTKDLFLIPKSKRFGLLKFVNSQWEHTKKRAKSFIELIGIL